MCNHIGPFGMQVVAIPPGTYRGCCGMCLKMGPPGGPSPQRAYDLFWEMDGKIKEGKSPLINFHTETQEVKKMPTYEEGYRKGVNDALEPYEAWEVEGHAQNQIIENRRRRLLTKKVTKWVNVIVGDGKNPVPARIFFDSQKEAEDHQEEGCPYFGVYPIEIEVPI